MKAWRERPLKLIKGQAGIVPDVGEMACGKNSNESLRIVGCEIEGWNSN